MNKEFMGYERPKGMVGIRNKIAIIPSVLCVNNIAEKIANKVDDAVAIRHPLGCGQFGPDFSNTFRTLAGLGSNPNIFGVIVVGLGCENLKSRILAKNIKRSKKPVESFDLQDIHGGSIAAIEHGIKIGKKMREEADEIKREAFDLSNLILGLECGGSDSISGISANPAIGKVSDKVIELGGTSILPEFTEWIGTEHLLIKRALNENVANKIQTILTGFIENLKTIGIDFLGVQPTPGNIEGGLSTIEEKSLGNIAKSGTALIQGLLEYSETPKSKGLWLMLEPGLDIESMTGLAAAGAHVILMTTGRGSPCGNPISPVIKLCGNPKTCNWMASDIDVDASKIITGESNLNQLADIIWEKLIMTCNGENTKSELLGFEDIAIWRNTASPFQYMHCK